MPGSYLYGWDSDNDKWVKLICNSDGKLIIDPSEIFENDPTENEHGKAPDSDWAYDHEADPAAHHAKYTDAEAVASFGNRIVTLTTGDYKDYDVSDVSIIIIDASSDDVDFYGFSGGVDGQILFLIMKDNSNSVHIKHNSSDVDVDQKIYCPAAANDRWGAGNWGVCKMICYDDIWYQDHLMEG